MLNKMNNVNDLSASSRITLAVPGGLSGQIFAVGYALWITKILNKKVHVQFYDVGTSISAFKLGTLLDSEASKEFDITYSCLKNGWPPSYGSQKFLKLVVGLLKKTIKKNLLVKAMYSWYQKIMVETVDRNLGYDFFQKRLVTEVISEDQLRLAKPGEKIWGYPTDFQIVEKSWPYLSKLISNHVSDFAKNCGQEDSVAIHWRLGDYINNDFHGAVSWTSIARCLIYANPNGFPVRIFTDSPDVAQQVLYDSKINTEIKVFSYDIWTDLYLMTRSKIFIGTQSGVSFLAALAIRESNDFARTWFPNRWFLHEGQNKIFTRPRETFSRSMFYDCELISQGIPY
jgi:hypothetical protein